MLQLLNCVIKALNSGFEPSSNFRHHRYQNTNIISQCYKNEVDYCSGKMFIRIYARSRIATTKRREENETRRFEERTRKPKRKNSRGLSFHWFCFYWDFKEKIQSLRKRNSVHSGLHESKLRTKKVQSKKKTNFVFHEINSFNFKIKLN